MGGAGGVIEAGGGTGAVGLSTVSLLAPAPFFFAGFLPFPWRARAGGVGAAVRGTMGSGPFARVSRTSPTSASDMNGFAIVAMTFRYFCAASIISGT
jgi:hypothetical protein